MVMISSLELNCITNITETPAKHHHEEWLSSGIDEQLIALNFRTIYDPSIVDQLLNRNNKSRWKHSTSLVPSWAVAGVDPRNGEPTLAGVQVKPDLAPINKQGKATKYLGASEYETTPLFLDTGINNFWKAVIGDKSKPVILSEGGKKAASGLSNGYITIAIPGVSTCKKDGRLHDLLKEFTGFGRTFYICFDNDQMYKKGVQDGLIGMARELSASGSKVMVIQLPPGDLKGMDDFLYHKGKDEFDKLIDNALTIEEWRKSLEENWIKQKLEEGEQSKCKLRRQFDIIRDGWGHSLRMNQMKNQIELSGEQLNLDQIRLRMAMEFEEAVPIGDAQAIVGMLADQKAYHPVNDYLETVAAQHPDPNITILDKLATRYFGSDNELHNIYMKKTLISAVARIKRPGCRVESVPILVNPRQGIGKSTFWRNLFGEDWFSDDMGDANEKDERMKLHNFWCLEWSEFENVYKKKDVSALKKFITTKTDSFRTPYSRTVKEYPRRSVLVGTTNEREILADPTGSRRFWVIPVQAMIPVEQVAAERDLLWAAAYALYKSGETWFLTSEQEELAEELNKPFQIIDPWLEKIQEYVEYKNLVTISELFHLLEIEVARRDIWQSKRIGSVMSRLGWEDERIRSGGKWVRQWTRKNPKVGFSTGSTGSASNAVDSNTDINGTADSAGNAINYTANSINHDNSQEDEATQSTGKKNTSNSGISPTEVTQQESQPIELQPDPVDPVEKPTFYKKIENNEVASETITRPQKCSYYSLYDTKPFIFKIESDFGTVQVSAEPYHRFKSGDSKIWLEFQTPDGQTLNKKIKAIPDKKLLPRFASECGVIQTWEEKVRKVLSSKIENPDYKFKVRILGDEDYQWIEDCILQSLPNRPSSTNFMFRTPENTIVTSAVGEFEEM